jgi:hypothetical protein
MWNTIPQIKIRINNYLKLFRIEARIISAEDGYDGGV